MSCHRIVDGNARRSQRLALGVVTATLAACSWVQLRYPDGTTAYRSKVEFEAYVEQVFRLENRVIDNLITANSLLDDDAQALDPRLVRAEEQMEGACRALNDAINAHLAGHALCLFEGLQLPTAVPACESASNMLQALLPPLTP